MFRKSIPHIESKNNKTDSVLYYNANLYNDPATQTAKLALFNQSISSGPIVDLPENYYMSIVRFAISHMVIPLYFFRENFYSITIENTVGPPVPRQRFLTYETAGSYSPYGYTDPVFYYQQFVDMVNAALDSASIASGAGANSVFLAYDTTLEKFSLYVDGDIWFPNPNPAPAIYKLFMNANLFQQLQFFNATFLGYNQPDGKDYEIIIQRYPGESNQVTLPDGNVYYQFTQEKNGLYLLNEIQSIVFTTSTLAVTKEFIGKNDGSGNAGSIPILADFVPDLSSGRDLSQYQYTPNGPFRLINLTNTIPITDIDYQIGIKTRDGRVYPLYLEPGEVSEVKFAFFKKSLFDNDFQY